MKKSAQWNMIILERWDREAVSETQSRMKKIEDTYSRWSWSDEVGKMQIAAWFEMMNLNEILK